MNAMSVSGGVAAMGCLVGLLCAQSPNAVHHPFLWDREFSQHPSLYTPEMAVVDSRGVLWVLCLARMGSEGTGSNTFRKQFFESTSRASSFLPLKWTYFCRQQSIWKLRGIGSLPFPAAKWDLYSTRFILKGAQHPRSGLITQNWGPTGLLPLYEWLPDRVPNSARFFA